MAVQYKGTGATNAPKDDSSKEQTQQTQEQPQQQQQGQQQFQQQFQHGLGSPKAAEYLQQLQGFHLGRTEAGEALVNAHRSISEYLEEKGMDTAKNRDGLAYRVIPADMNETASFMSAVVIVGVLEGKDVVQPYAFCHTIVLEGSIQGQLPQAEPQYGSNQPPVTQTLQDLIDTSYLERLRNVIASKLFVDGQVALVDCGVNILPKSKTLRNDTAEAKSLLSAQVFYAVSAINNERTKLVTKLAGMDLTQMNDGELQASADYNPVEHMRNASGDPVRTDVRIVGNFAYRDAEGRSRTILLSDVALAATMLYQPQTSGYGSAPIAGGYNQNNTPVQNWMPAFTITRNDTGTPVVTLEQTLLGIAMATVTMTERLAWADVFYANRDKAHMNLGALPVIDDGEQVDLAAATVTPEEYRNFLYNYVQEDPVFFYHVDRYDELGFANDPLLLAVNGDQNAISDIWNAMNNLCGGALAAVLPREKLTAQMIGFTSPRLVPMGSYMPEGGAFAHDRRELDMLAILGSKMSNRKEHAIALYVQDNDTSTDARLRLQNRKRIEQDLLGSSLVDTGYAYEVMISPDLISILVSVIKAAQMKVVKRLEVAQNADRTFFNPAFRQNAIQSGFGQQLFTSSNLGGGFTGLGNMAIKPRGWN